MKCFLTRILFHRLSDASGKMKMTKEKAGKIEKTDFDSNVRRSFYTYGLYLCRIFHALL